MRCRTSPIHDGCQGPGAGGAPRMLPTAARDRSDRLRRSPARSTRADSPQARRSPPSPRRLGRTSPGPYAFRGVNKNRSAYFFFICRTHTKLGGKIRAS